MAERGRGPMRPPIIEGEARAPMAGDHTPGAERTGGEPQTLADRVDGAAEGESGPVVPDDMVLGPSEPARTPADGDVPATEPPHPGPFDGAGAAATTASRAQGQARPERARHRAFPALLSMLGGALMGAGLVYALAYWGYLPGQGSEDGGRIETLEAQFSALEASAGPDEASDLAQRVAALESTQQQAPDALSTLQSIESRVAGLEQQGGDPETGGVDLTAIETQLSELASRVDALGNSAPQTDALAGELAALRQQLTTLGEQTTAMGQQIANSEAAVSGLRGEFEAAQAAAAEAAAQAAEVDPVIEAGRLLRALEAALMAGGPYGPEYDALAGVVAGLPQPGPELSARRDSGLLTHAEVSQRVAAAVPGMLAARPADPDAGLVGGAMDWLRSTLALRPSGDIEGDAPDAQVSRLENAVARQDYAEAAAVLSAMPEPMRTQAGDLMAELQARAEAQALIAQAETAVAALGQREGQP